MPCWTLLLLLAALPSWAGAAKHIASYDIKATLHPKAHELNGTEVLTWLNDSPDTVKTLQFHLYMNAFKNEKTTFQKESGGRLRSDIFEKKDWGWIDIKRMQIVGGADLTKAIRFIHPDDDNADDQTVIEVTLPEPVGPGKSIQIGIDFLTKFPQIFARTGFRDEYYLGGQWFPKIGVWEEEGFRGSKQGHWNCHQFHAHSEFFSNFGRYRVELTFPSHYVVGATGVQKSRTEDAKAKTSTYVFEQDDVTDFAWTASPLFQRLERKFIPAEHVSLKEIAEIARIHNISEDEVRLKEVTMILLIQPEHAGQIERHFKATIAGLKYFGLWYGAYPYDTITVVDPCYGAEGSGGMEYPTFITAGTSYSPMDDETNPETVIVHEFGHQFWKEMVATNEFEESWMDEGFNTYSTSKIIDKVYGPGRLPVRAFTLNLGWLLDLPKITQLQTDRAGYLAGPVLDDLVRPSWQYYNSLSYGLNSYMRTGVTLDTLERLLGSETMDRVMRTYYQKFRFGHPYTEQFFEVANAVAGRDLSYFFSQFVRGNRLLDYAVGDVESDEVETAIGVFDKGNGKVTIDSKAAREADEKAHKDKKKTLYETTAKIRRVGDAVIPVDILFRFEDGTEERRTWDGEYRWVKYTFTKPAKIQKVVVDPERKLLLDVNLANNSYTMEPQIALLTKWPSNLLFWMQNTLLWMSSLV